MVVSTNGVKPFTIQRRKAVLEFEQVEYEGMRIEAKLDVDLRTFLDLQMLAGSGDANASDLKDAFIMFGDKILEAWNLEDEDGNPVTADADGFLTLPPSVCTAVLGAWSNAASSAGEALPSA